VIALLEGTAEQQAPTDKEQLAEEEAASWLDRIERSLTRAEGVELRKWLRVSLHRRTIVHQCRLWHGPEILAVLAELVPTESLQTRVERQYGRFILLIFLAVSGMGFMTVLIAAAKFFPGNEGRRNPHRIEESYRTDVGAQQTVDLPDGSRAILNTSTRLLVSFGLRTRDTTLVRGEATFKVVGDPNRAFRVHAGARRFVVHSGRAHFNLRRRPDETVELTVIEGQVVALESGRREPLSPALIRARVTQGEHGFVAGEGGLLGAGWQLISSVHQEEIDTKTRWQSGTLGFSDTRLEELVREIERYTNDRFLFADDELRDLRFSGEVSIRNLDAGLEGLRTRLMIKAHKYPSGDIVLARATSGQLQE
jgi:transmembrane sensor